MKWIPTSLSAALVLAVPGTTLVADPQFVDVTAAANINYVQSYGPIFVQVTGRLEQRNLGNGAAVGDYDGDGDLDLYILGNLTFPNVLYRNDLDLGAKTFTDVTETAGVGDTGLSRVAHFVDLDNDGWLDLLLVNDDDGFQPPSKIFRNNGNGTFFDVTAGSGFTPTGYARCGAALADYDGDGRLDIYVTNWSGETGTGVAQFIGCLLHVFDDEGNTRCPFSSGHDGSPNG